MMNKLARLSAAERKQIIDDFTAGVFDGLEPNPRNSPRWSAGHNLPDDPSPEQIEAWLELAADPDFRRCIRQVAGYGIQHQAGRWLLDIDRAQENAEAPLAQNIEPKPRG